MLIDANPVNALPARSTNPYDTAWYAVKAFLLGYENAKTREAYEIDLRIWFTWLDELGVDDPIHDVQRPHVEMLMRQMEANGAAPATICRRVGTLNVFYERLIDDEILMRNPCRKVKRPHVSQESNRPWLKRRALSDWLDASQELGGYHYAFGSLLALNALRSGELCGLDISSMGTDDYRTTLRFIGKGYKPALVPVPPRAAMAVDRALDGRKAGPLVVQSFGGRLNRESAILMCRHINAKARTDMRVTPHGIRHSAISALLDQGANPRDVMIFARHERFDTTVRYDRSRDNLDRHCSFALQSILGNG